MRFFYDSVSLYNTVLVSKRALLRQLALDASRGGASPQKIRETRA